MLRPPGKHAGPAGKTNHTTPVRGKRYDRIIADSRFHYDAYSPIRPIIEKKKKKRERNGANSAIVQYIYSTLHLILLINLQHMKHVLGHIKPVWLATV